MDFRVVETKRLYNGKVFNLIVDQIEYPNGHRAIREVAEHPGGAVVLAMFPDERIILVKQFRYPLGKFLHELPAGKLDPNEDPAICAARELEEETGYKARNWRKFSAIYTSPGFCTEQLHIFLATDLSRSAEGQKLEEGEQSLMVEIVPLSKAIEMIEHEEIVDGKTICGILIAERLLRNNSPLLTGDLPAGQAGGQVDDSTRRG
jgi:ADP-ribose pyrophosphatase